MGDDSANRWEEKRERQRSVSGCRDFYELEKTDEVIGLTFRGGKKIKRQERKLQFLIRDSLMFLLMRRIVCN